MTFPISASPIECSGRGALSRALFVCALLVCTLFTAARVTAEGPPKPTQLPELPAIPSIEVPRPAPADLEELDARLHKLCSSDAAEREQARRETLEVTAKLVPALRYRLASLAESSNHDELKEVLLAVRKKGRDEARDEQREDGKHDRLTTPDYLQMASEHPERRSTAWCTLVSVLGESRMLAHVGTVEAVRGLIDVYVRYGEFLRVDTQLQLEDLGDRAVPALIETRRHPAEKVAKWSLRELDALGKAIPSETVQTTDLQVLADVLRAYGRVRDPDAARIVVSFANSERAQIREASRQAIAMFGEVGAWQLRDTYEDVVGKKPPRDWTWERTARELFAEFDRLRSAEVSKLYDAGASARDRGDLDGMRRAFDQVLTRSPDYPKRAELAAAYLDYAQKKLDVSGSDASNVRNASDASGALGRAERLGQGTPLENSARSLRLTLEAEALGRAGIADRTLLMRAREADPQNARAERELARFGNVTKPDEDSSRYLAAGAIGAVALAGIAFVLLRRETPHAAAPSDAGSGRTRAALGSTEHASSDANNAAAEPNRVATEPTTQGDRAAREPEPVAAPNAEGGGAPGKKREAKA